MRINESLLKDIIKEENLIGTGTFGNVLFYEKCLYKIYKEFIIAVQLEKEEKYEYAYEKYNILNYEMIKLNKMIDYYNKVQSKIKHTKLPKELVLLKSSYAGIILPYSKGKTLNECNYTKSELFYVLERVLYNLEELNINKIYHLDIEHGGNILYDQENNDINIIDLDYGKHPLYREMNCIEFNSEDLSYEVYNQFIKLVERLVPLKTNIYIPTNTEPLYTYDDTKRVLWDIKRMVK